MSVERRGASLTHAIPRGTDVFSYQLTASYPFPTLWPAKEETSGLVTLLPRKEDLYFYLNSFQRRAQMCSFPHVPEECTEREVQRFLENIEPNAALYPNMLALLFATLAQGLQEGIYDRNGGKWVAGSVDAEMKKGDIYSERISRLKSPYKLTQSSCRGISSTKGSLIHESANAP